jgi:hypothetical protein
MRFLLPLLLLALPLAACGGPEDVGAGESIDDGAESLGASTAAEKSDCRGFASAHCLCRIVAGPEMSTGPAGSTSDANVEGQVLFTYVLPNRCYNQVVDAANHHFDKGCWKDCRDAFGIEGHARDPAVTRLIAQAGRDLRALGACGGWNSAPLEFAAGTNRFKSAAAAGIGVGIGGTVVTVNGQRTCR